MWAEETFGKLFPSNPELSRPIPIVHDFTGSHLPSCPQFFVINDERPDAPTTLPAFVDQYSAIRPIGGLVVSWVMFGSSGHLKRPKVRLLL